MTHSYSSRARNFVMIN